MSKYPTNSPEFEQNRKKLRTKGTAAEATLWGYLKERQLAGRKFRRQFGIENYILDFYCVEEKLNIELDGQEHFEGEGYGNDLKRDTFLQTLGIKILRFENRLVFEAIDHVLKEIKQQFSKDKIFDRGLPKEKHYLVGL